MAICKPLQISVLNRTGSQTERMTPNILPCRTDYYFPGNKNNPVSLKQSLLIKMQHKWFLKSMPHYQYQITTCVFKQSYNIFNMVFHYTGQKTLDIKNK